MKKKKREKDGINGFILYLQEQADWQLFHRESEKITVDYTFINTDHKKYNNNKKNHNNSNNHNNSTTNYQKVADFVIPLTLN